MKTFSIQGSKALCEAFAKDSGISIYKQCKFDLPYLSYDNEGELSGHDKISDIHFDLATQYQEAIDFINNERRQEESNIFRTLDGVDIRIDIDKCHCINIIDKFYPINEKKRVWDKDDFENPKFKFFDNKQKADVYLHWLKGGKVKYITPLGIPGYPSTNIIRDECWAKFKWEIIEEPTNEYQPKEGDIVIGFADVHAISIGIYHSCVKEEGHFVYNIDGEKTMAYYGKVYPYSPDKLHSLMKEHLGYVSQEEELMNKLKIRVEKAFEAKSEEAPKLTAKTRDGIEVEISDTNKVLNTGCFYVFLNGDIKDRHHFQIIDNDNRVFHSKAKAELFAEGVKGKHLQYEFFSRGWISIDCNSIDWSEDIEHIRVKPDEIDDSQKINPDDIHPNRLCDNISIKPDEPLKYRPYYGANWSLFNKVIKSKDGKRIMTIMGIDTTSINSYHISDDALNNEELFNDWTFEDDSPIGHEVIN